MFSHVSVHPSIHPLSACPQGVLQPGPDGGGGYLGQVQNNKWSTWYAAVDMPCVHTGGLSCFKNYFYFTNRSTNYEVFKFINHWNSLTNESTKSIRKNLFGSIQVFSRMKSVESTDFVEFTENFEKKNSCIRTCYLKDQHAT